MEWVNERERDCTGFGELKFQWLYIQTSGDDLTLWHSRMYHPSLRTSLVPGLRSLSSDSDILFQNCDVCLRAKQTRQIFSESSNKVNAVFDLIHCDL